MSSVFRTPETNKENAKSRVRNLQQSKLGRVPLSPSKGKSAPSSKVDDLADDLEQLSVVSGTRPATSVPSTAQKHPLAAPPTTASSTPATTPAVAPPTTNRRLKSIPPASAASSSGVPSSVAQKPTRAESTSRSSSSSRSASSTRKGIDDYRSPVQLISREPDWEALAPQAQHGMLGLNQDLPLNLTGVVKNDWEGHQAVVSDVAMAKAREMSRSRNGHVELPKASDAMRSGDDATDDRYVGQRDAEGGIHGHSLAGGAEQLEPTEDLAHEHQLRDALSLEPSTERIVSFASAAPKPRQDPTLSMAHSLVQPAYARPGAVSGSGTGVYTNKSRRIASTAEKILDAPGMINDYYLNLISWSASNFVGVALRESVYVWNAETNETELLSTCEQEGEYVSSIDFSNDGSYAGIGLNNGDVEIWDIETKTRLRGMSGHQSQVSVLSWNNHIVSSGCADGSIWHHDVRVGDHKVMELLGHTGEVCGLKWRPDGELLASGGNDNVVNCWDGRVGSVGGDLRGVAKWSKTTHTAAVKAIAWAPWNTNLLASGGGTSDCRINIWSATTGSRLHSISTPAQVTSIQFSPHSKEIFSTHGFPTNALMVHAYPSGERVAEIRDAHDARVLNSGLSPGGDMVVTSGGDENIKFWRIWEVPQTTGKSKKAGGRKENTGVEKELKSIR